MTTQFYVAEEYGRNSAKKFVVHETEILNQEARIALALIERWGMVTAEEGGEDSAGRARLRKTTPEEVVDRACSIANGAMDEFRKRGWVVAGPDVSELLRTTDD